MDRTGLYHCTDFESLFKIIKSKAFWPSYCYEKADYLEEPESFAFAMVCFADLLKSEIKPHLKKFNKDCYLHMNKEWAKQKGLSNVIYYNKTSVTAALLRNMIKDLTGRSGPNKKGDLSNEAKFINLMMAFFKQYEGYYWNDDKSQWSRQKTLFYTEREWRYIPLVQNHEAYYLSPNDFLDKDFRQTKRNELVQNGYKLEFVWNDINHIGIHSFKQWLKICKYLIYEQHYNIYEVIKKIKWVF